MEVEQHEKRPRVDFHFLSRRLRKARILSQNTVLDDHLSTLPFPNIH